MLLTLSASKCSNHEDDSELNASPARFCIAIYIGVREVVIMPGRFGSAKGTHYEPSARMSPTSVSKT